MGYHNLLVRSDNKILENSRMRRVLALASLIGLAGCELSTYQPPKIEPASFGNGPARVFSKEFAAPYEKVWSAAIGVAGSTFFKVKSVEKASGIITLEYSVKDPIPYVECGRIADGTPYLREVVLTGRRDGVALDGTANVTITNISKKRTTVQINVFYHVYFFEAAARIYQGDYLVHPQVEREKFQFATMESDTLPDDLHVTCRPSFKIETDFLNAIAGRL
jgi:hypothetical protein